MTTFFAGQIPTAQQLDDTALVGTVVAQLRQSVAQNLADATVVALTLDIEDYDVLGGHSTVTNTSRYTCQREGWYTLAGGVAYAGSANATSLCTSRWRLNGADLNGSEVGIPSYANASFATIVPARTYVIYLVVGDFVELAAFQRGATAARLTAVLSSQQSNMHVTYSGLPN